MVYCYIFVPAGLALFLALLLYILPGNLIPGGGVVHIGTAAVIASQEQSVPGLPIRLKIPTIDVDAAVEYVGVASDGNMDVPNGTNAVAWFQFGPRPGEIGSAVIAGHFGWKDGTSAAFDNLSALKKGDELNVQDTNGTMLTFVVRETRLYDPKSDASSVFNSSDGKAHLNLVTCEGVWDAASKSYSKRLVVFAEKE